MHLCPHYPWPEAFDGRYYSRNRFSGQLYHRRQPQELDKVLLPIRFASLSIFDTDLCMSRYQKDFDAFGELSKSILNEWFDICLLFHWPPTVNVIKGALQLVSVPPGNSFSSILARAAWAPPVGKPLVSFGNNPLQSRERNLSGTAITRTVGGMASHWTCASRMSLIGCSLFDYKHSTILLQLYHMWMRGRYSMKLSLRMRSKPFSTAPRISWASALTSSMTPFAIMLSKISCRMILILRSEAWRISPWQSSVDPITLTTLLGLLAIPSLASMLRTSNCTRKPEDRDPISNCIRKPE